MYFPATQVSVTLSNNVDPHWRRCYSLTHEMSMTAAGRRIFPSLQYQIKGLDPEQRYSMSLQMAFVDNKKLKYSMESGYTKTWCTMPPEPSRMVWHQLGNQPGSLWMEHDISFDNIRITNRKKSEDKGQEYIFLHTQHRYIPVLKIYQDGNPIVEVRIPYTEFISVTNYHVPELVTYKINTNPHSTAARTQPRINQPSSGKIESLRYSKRWRKATKKELELPPFDPSLSALIKSLPAPNVTSFSDTTSTTIPNSTTFPILPFPFAFYPQRQNIGLFMSLMSQAITVPFFPGPFNHMANLAFFPTPASTPSSLPSVSPEQPASDVNTVVEITTIINNNSKI